MNHAHKRKPAVTSGGRQQRQADPTGPSVAPADVEINGAKLRELRKLMGDNLSVFATRAGITLQYVSQLERGVRRRVSPATFVRICDALGIDDRREMMMPDTITGR